MAIEKIDAILSLVPNADCALTGGVITEWNSEEAQPTEEEITAEMETLQAEYDEVKPTTPTGTRDWYVKWLSMILAVLGVF